MLKSYRAPNSVCWQHLFPFIPAQTTTFAAFEWIWHGLQAHGMTAARVGRKKEFIVAAELRAFLRCTGFWCEFISSHLKPCLPFNCAKCDRDAVFYFAVRISHHNLMDLNCMFIRILNVYFIRPINEYNRLNVPLFTFTSKALFFWPLCVLYGRACV